MTSFYLTRSSRNSWTLYRASTKGRTKPSGFREVRPVGDPPQASHLSSPSSRLTGENEFSALHVRCAYSLQSEPLAEEAPTRSGKVKRLIMDGAIVAFLPAPAHAHEAVL